MFYFESNFCKVDFPRYLKKANRFDPVGKIADIADGNFMNSTSLEPHSIVIKLF